ncbi:MAG: class I SAM-dependent methyltransferase [Pseudomonadota bacterium]
MNSETASFWDRTAPKYAKKPIKDPKAYAAKLEALRLHLTASDTVLEVGCGTGTTALHLAPEVANYTATDRSPAMIKIAEEKRLSGWTSNLSFAVADATKPIKGAPFDVVMAFSLLHLVDDLPATLYAIHNQLRPGGLFLSKTVCLGEANLAIRLLVKTLRLVGLAPRVLFLSKAELREALITAGFAVEDCRYFNRGSLNPFFIARRAA